MSIGARLSPERRATAAWVLVDAVVDVVDRVRRARRARLQRRPRPGICPEQAAPMRAGWSVLRDAALRAAPQNEGAPGIYCFSQSASEAPSALAANERPS